jgi:CubicO group peptidase (beta-lactamase class C family)
MSWTVGFGKFGNTFGWGGWGGSLVVSDPGSRITVAYVMNQMIDRDQQEDNRGMEIVMAPTADCTEWPAGWQYPLASCCQLIGLVRRRAWRATQNRFLSVDPSASMYRPSAPAGSPDRACAVPGKVRTLVRAATRSRRGSRRFPASLFCPSVPPGSWHNSVDSRGQE